MHWPWPPMREGTSSCKVEVMTPSCRQRIVFSAFFSASLFAAGCDSNAPSASIKLKRGAAVRVINLTDDPLSATFGDRPIPCARLDSETSEFILVPPAKNHLQLSNGRSPFEQNVPLKAEGYYTFVVQRKGNAYGVSTFEGDP